MRSQPSRAPLVAVGATKVAVVGAIAYLALTPVLVEAQTVTSDPEGPTPSDVGAQTHLDRLMERFDCSPTGLGPDVIPGSALVERDDRVRRVSFDDGWAVFTGDTEGRLVAVCRASV